MTQVKLPSIRYFQVPRVQRDCQGEMGNQALQVLQVDEALSALRV